MVRFNRSRLSAMISSPVRRGSRACWKSAAMLSRMALIQTSPQAWIRLTNAKLERTDEDARGGKVTLFARLFHAPLRGLLGLFIFVRHSLPGDEAAHGAETDADPGPEQCRQKQRQPAEHGQTDHHLYWEGYGEQLQLGVHTTQQGQRNVDHNQDGDDGKREPQSRAKHGGANGNHLSGRAASKDKR